VVTGPSSCAVVCRRFSLSSKKESGIQSDSRLIEAALANLVVADDYADGFSPSALP